MSRVQRTRTVVFRLTQSEYEQLRVACAGSGARNLSDYTRTELLNCMRTDRQGMTVPERFVAIDQKLGELEQAVSRISEILSDARPALASRGSSNV
jgi:hypothetical protein